MSWCCFCISSDADMFKLTQNSRERDSRNATIWGCSTFFGQMASWDCTHVSLRSKYYASTVYLLNLYHGKQSNPCLQAGSPTLSQSIPWDKPCNFVQGKEIFLRMRPNIRINFEDNTYSQVTVTEGLTVCEVLNYHKVFCFRFCFCFCFIEKSRYPVFNLLTSFKLLPQTKNMY